MEGSIVGMGSGTTRTTMVVHPDLLPPREALVIMPPPDGGPEDRYWFIGFISRDGLPVPLGRILWFGGFKEYAGGDDGVVLAESEELDEPPKGIREYLTKYGRMA